MRYQTHGIVAAILMIATPSVVFAQSSSTPPAAAAPAPADRVQTPTGAGTMHGHDGMMKDGQAMGSGMRKEGQSMGKDRMDMGKGMGMGKEGMVNKGDKGG